MKIRYQDKKFHRASLEKIEFANQVVERYERQGLKLTLRQLYYQFVANNVIPNNQKEYDNLGNLINDARLAGLLSWTAIEDRTRNLQKLSTIQSPTHIIEAAANQYLEDLWASQEQRVEVWIEKEALAGVFERVCNQLRVPFFACRGYVSQSEMWWAATQRLKHYRDSESNRQSVVILHFGDHDPSGIDMTRDIVDRFRMFGCSASIKRIALNFDQVEQYNPPPNPAKSRDSRFNDYVQNYGYDCWELDALEPSVLYQLVSDNVDKYKNERAWNDALTDEQTNRGRLKTVSDRWENVSYYIDTHHADTLAKNTAKEHDTSEYYEEG